LWHLASPVGVWFPLSFGGCSLPRGGAPLPFHLVHSRVAVLLGTCLLCRSLSILLCVDQSLALNTCPFFPLFLSNSFNYECELLQQAPLEQLHDRLNWSPTSTTCSLFDPTIIPFNQVKEACLFEGLLLLGQRSLPFPLASPPSTVPPPLLPFIQLPFPPPKPAYFWTRDGKLEPNWFLPQRSPPRQFSTQNDTPFPECTVRLPRFPLPDFH